MDADNITGDKFLGLDARDVPTIPDDVRFVGRVFLEGGNGLLRAAFLGNSDNGIEDKNGENLRCKGDRLAKRRIKHKASVSRRG